MQYHVKPSNTVQFHAILCNTMQYHSIQCNTMQYYAIPCIIHNCWRSVPLPCGQYMAIFNIYFNIWRSLSFLSNLISDNYCVRLIWLATGFIYDQVTSICNANFVPRWSWGLHSQHWPKPPHADRERGGSGGWRGHLSHRVLRHQRSGFITLAIITIPHNFDSSSPWYNSHYDSIKLFQLEPSKECSHT